MAPIAARRLTTPAEVEPWLLDDRAWCAYALADLEEPLWSRCRVWVVASGSAESPREQRAVGGGSIRFAGRRGTGTSPPGRLEPFWSRNRLWAVAAPARAVLLHLHLDRWDALFAHGDAGALATLLAAAEALPARANLILREPARAAFERYYAIENVDTMLRQVVRPETFRPVVGEAVRLMDPRELREFYEGRMHGYDDAQLEGGVYFGAREAGATGRLLAAAGTHAVSRRHRIGALGNVLTEPAARGRGLGAAVASAVVAALFERGCSEVVLNVRADNVPALRLYERLGFVTACEFLEARGTLRK